MNTARLKKFFYGLSEVSRESFAADCGTSSGQIKQIISGHRNCNPALAINIERESNGAVLCDELCPRVDFAYLRNTQAQALPV